MVFCLRRLRYCSNNSSASFIAIFLIEQTAIDHGTKSFERFISEAEKSQIPSEFIEAYQNVGKGIDLTLPDKATGILTSRLLERSFKTTDLGLYALCYTRAISGTKKYLAMQTRVDRHIQTLNMEMGPIKDDFIRIMARLGLGIDIDKLIKSDNPLQISDQPEWVILGLSRTLEAMRREEEIRSQITSCLDMGRQAAIIECGKAVAYEESIKKQKLRKQLTLSKVTTFRDLEGTRREVEKYFSDSSKRARIILLSR